MGAPTAPQMYHSGSASRARAAMLVASAWSVASRSRQVSSWSRLAASPSTRTSVRSCGVAGRAGLARGVDERGDVQHRADELLRQRGELLGGLRVGGLD